MLICCGLNNYQIQDYTHIYKHTRLAVKLTDVFHILLSAEQSWNKNTKWHALWQNYFIQKNVALWGEKGQGENNQDHHDISNLHHSTGM